MKPTISLGLLLTLITCSWAQAQTGAYLYKRELNGIADQWHRIALPDSVFGKIRPDLADLRIFGIRADHDTLEAPYLLQVATEKVADRLVAFKTINTSRNAQGYFYTFELATEETVNQINLKFYQQNFDWQVLLEGSQDQREWFTLLDQYRILSIRNEHTDFQFTKLAFPDARYRFYRLRIPAGENPGLHEATLWEHTLSNGSFRTYPATQMVITENKKNRQTEIDLALPLPVPVSRLRIAVRERFDYYRPTTIAGRTDSVKTEQGWTYNYATLANGTLNSLEDNVFRFSGATCQHLKITIENQDNQPLTIDTVAVNGYVHELVARFTEPADYFLAYGNAKAVKPQYDIERFTDKIPEELQPLTLGNEQLLAEATPSPEPLFMDKRWLWGVILLVGALLGWFTVVLMRRR